MASTDPIYGSGQPSVIDNRTGDRRGRINDPVTATADAPYDYKSKNSNKYYANGGGKPQGTTVVKSQRGATGAVGHPQSTDPIIVRTHAQVNAARDAVIARLAVGQTYVKVKVGSTELRRLFKTQIDMVTAREQITEDQARDVHVQLLGQPAEAPKVVQKPIKKKSIQDQVDDGDAPTPDAAVRVPDETEDLPPAEDFGKFVLGDSTESVVIKSTPHDEVNPLHEMTEAAEAQQVVEETAAAPEPEDADEAAETEEPPEPEDVDEEEDVD